MTTINTKNLCTVFATGDFNEDMMLRNALLDNGFKTVGSALVKTFDLCFATVEETIAKVYIDEINKPRVLYISSTHYADETVTELLDESIKAFL